MLASKELSSVLKSILDGESPIVSELCKGTDLSDPKTIATRMEQALSEKDYSLLKMLNEILSYHDYREKRGMFRHYPLVLQLEHTSKCNAECIMCIHYYKGNRGAFNLDESRFRNLLPIFPYLQRIVLHGNGEPFMDPQLEEHLTEYRRFGIKVSTNTNMSILPTCVIDNADLFESVNVSIDSHREEVYNAIRLHLDLQKVTENVDMFHKAATGTYMTLSAVVMRQNIQDLEGLTQYAADHGFQAISFSQVGINDNAVNAYDNPTLYPGMLKQHLRAAIEVARKNRIEIEYPDYFLDLPDGNVMDESNNIVQYPFAPPCARHRNHDADYRWDLYGFDLLPRPSQSGCRGLCDRLLSTLMVTANGNAVACCIDVTHNVGKMDSDFSEIWNGKPLINLREMFYSGNLPTICRGCMFIQNGSLKLLDVERGGDFYNTKKNEN